MSEKGVDKEIVRRIIRQSKIEFRRKNKENLTAQATVKNIAEVVQKELQDDSKKN